MISAYKPEMTTTDTTGSFESPLTFQSQGARGSDQHTIDNVGSMSGGGLSQKPVEVSVCAIARSLEVWHDLRETLTLQAVERYVTVNEDLWRQLEKFRQVDIPRNWCTASALRDCVRCFLYQAEKLTISAAATGV